MPSPYDLPGPFDKQRYGYAPFDMTLEDVALSYSRTPNTANRFDVTRVMTLQVNSDAVQNNYVLSQSQAQHGCEEEKYPIGDRFEVGPGGDLTFVSDVFVAKRQCVNRWYGLGGGKTSVCSFEASTETKVHLPLLRANTDQKDCLQNKSPLLFKVGPSTTDGPRITNQVKSCLRVDVGQIPTLAAIGGAVTGGLLTAVTAGVTTKFVLDKFPRTESPLGQTPDIQINRPSEVNTLCPHSIETQAVPSNPTLARILVIDQMSNMVPEQGASVFAVSQGS